MSRYIEERRGVFGVEPICRVLGVPVSTHYARRSRVPSRRELEDRQLVAEITAAWTGHRRAYGARKTWKELRRRGIEVGRDRVARLMREQGLEGKRRGGSKRTTIPDEAAVDRARDLVQRDFSATRPNEKCVCDITYVRTWRGFCYFAFIIDCYSRMIVGWQLATHMRTDLVLDALEMASELGAASSVGSRGDAYANAMAEAWVATFKSEFVDGRRFPSYEHAEHETLHWIGVYNEERLHEALGDLPSAEYEELNYKEDNTRMLATRYRASNEPRADHPANLLKLRFHQLA